MRRMYLGSVAEGMPACGHFSIVSLFLNLADVQQLMNMLTIIVFHRKNCIFLKDNLFSNKEETELLHNDDL